MSEVFRNKIDIDLKVNGEPVEARVPAGQHLIDFLRLELGLTGAHASCEHGVCGACTVKGRRSGRTGLPDAGCTGRRSRGLDHRRTVRHRCDHRSARGLCGAQRDAMRVLHAGMLVAAEDLLSQNAEPSRAEIREHLSGNYCRCTGYEAIVDAVETVARARAGKGAA